MKTDQKAREDVESCAPTDSHPAFRVADITAGSVFTLSSGAKLTIARNPNGVLITGEYGKIESHIAISEEAAEILISALLLSRPDKSKPLPNARLLPVGSRT